MEVLDRIIGSQIDEIDIQHAFEAFMAFTSAQKATIRPKIVSLLLRTLTDNLDQLLPIQLLHLCETLLASNESKDQTNHSGSHMIRGLDLDKFVINNLGAYDSLDLVRAVEVFADSTLEDVQEALET